MNNNTIETLKTCKACDLPQPVSHFSKQSAAKDGLYPKCRSCCKKYRREYYLKNKEKELQTSKEYRKNNPEVTTQWLEAKRECGVYKIECVKSGRFYYGGTTHMYNRFNCHMSFLRNNSHPVTALQNDFNRYGEDSIVFTKLHICKPTEVAANEAVYVNEWVDNEMCYNTNKVNA